MKNTTFRMVFVLLGMILLVPAVKADSLTGNSQTSFGNYTYSPSSQAVVIDDVAHKTWTLSYSGSDKKFIVFYTPAADGQCCFVVKNDEFEIQYAKTANGFGARLVDASKRSLPKKQVMAQINAIAFEQQKVLTSNPKSEEEYLGLIACFMPLLFNN